MQKINVEYLNLYFGSYRMYLLLSKSKNQRGLVYRSIIVDGMYFDFIESLPFPERLGVLDPKPSIYREAL